MWLSPTTAMMMMTTLNHKIEENLNHRDAERRIGPIPACRAKKPRESAREWLAAERTMPITLGSEPSAVMDSRQKRQIIFFDKFSGKNARIVGGDNAKGGADRLVDGVEIQSKYWSSGAKCVAECFENGKFKYLGGDGSPMQIEVPSDMYEGAVKAMEARIAKGHVKGVTDPGEAREIVRKGHFTYAQAKNVARFGTVESLTYDAGIGVKLSAQAMGISAALSFAASIWNGEDLETALKQACETGIKVGGVAWVGSIVAAQLGRTGVEQALRGSTDWIVRQMGPKAAALAANTLRSGGSIHGAAAMNHVSKLLRGNLVTGIATTAVLSSVDFARMFQGRMSGAQLFKNVATTASGVAGWYRRMDGRHGRGVLPQVRPSER